MGYIPFTLFVVSSLLISCLNQKLFLSAILHAFQKVFFVLQGVRIEDMRVAVMPPYWISVIEKALNN